MDTARPFSGARQHRLVDSAVLVGAPPAALVLGVDVASHTGQTALGVAGLATAVLCVMAARVALPRLSWATAVVGVVAAAVLLVVGVAAEWISLLATDACPSVDVPTPGYVTPLADGAAVVVYLVVAVFALRDGGRRRWAAPFAPGLAVVGSASVLIALAATGMPHHCYT
jgi:hypothetical protein